MIEEIESMTDDREKLAQDRYGDTAFDRLADRVNNGVLDPGLRSDIRAMLTFATRLPSLGVDDGVREALEGEVANLRERLADAYVLASGSAVHRSDCATSCAPAELPYPCDCGAANDGPRHFQALLKIAGCAPIEKPEGPYDPMGGYCSDNYGDVISAAFEEADWNMAEIARAALTPANKQEGE